MRAVKHVHAVQYMTVLPVCRFDLNWIKLRAWELPGWDALLWLDSDTAVAGNVSPLFNLPTHFAGTLDVARRHRRQVHQPDAPSPPAGSLWLLGWVS